MDFEIKTTSQKTRVVLVCSATEAATVDERLFRAQTYEVAAAAEMASAGESWAVSVRFEGPKTSAVVLELRNADEEEVVVMALEAVIERMQEVA